MEERSAHANRVECIGVEHRLYRNKVVRRIWISHVDCSVSIC